MGNARDIPRKAGAVPVLTAVALAAPLLVAGAAGAACPQPAELNIGDRSGRFVQTRHLVGLDVPLVSEGVFRLRGDLLDWHVQTPFDVRTIIESNGITQAIDGDAPRAVEPGTNAVVAPVTEALAAVLRADFGALRRSFAVTAAPAGNIGDSGDSGDSGGWTATLVPVDEDLRALLGTIDIQGCQTVDHVTLRRPSGDSDRIDLYPLSPTGPVDGAPAR